MSKYFPDSLREHDLYVALKREAKLGEVLSLTGVTFVICKCYSRAAWNQQRALAADPRGQSSMLGLTASGTGPDFDIDAIVDEVPDLRYFYGADFVALG